MALGRKKKAGAPGLDALRRVDVCFVIDTTGSMGPFIQAAKRQLISAIERLGAEADIDLQVAMVQYRDHPPQDSSFVTRTEKLTGDLRKMQRAIKKLTATGGGDGPEAVLDGVHEACTGIAWRAGSWRFALLVGDAPPHGVRPEDVEPAGRRRRRYGGYYGDGFPDGCPCGETIRSVSAAAEEARVTLHAICMDAFPLTQLSFSEIAVGSGGQCVFAAQGEEVVRRMIEALQAELEHLSADREALAALEALGEIDLDRAAEALERPRVQIAGSVARLGRRGLLDHLV